MKFQLLKLICKTNSSTEGKMLLITKHKKKNDNEKYRS